jgi:hypothetical protein
MRWLAVLLLLPILVQTQTTYPLPSSVSARFVNPQQAQVSWQQPGRAWLCIVATREPVVLASACGYFDAGPQAVTVPAGPPFDAAYTLQAGDRLGVRGVDMRTVWSLPLPAWGRWQVWLPWVPETRDAPTLH